MIEPAPPNPPSPVQAIGRALMLHCPNCGSGAILRTWFALTERCPRCNLKLGRDEADYFLGAYILSLVFLELIFAITFVVVLVLTWPDPPWRAIQWGGATLMVAAALIVYPFAKTLWLAADLIFRPAGKMEMRDDGTPREGELDSRR
ncbi:MAG TPA: DUF983 domain-containing protein [Gemmatimonadaceae bacterium]|nr:DUF983 domain-containing protein [Gemmatimonadaceae bacterium]